MLLCKSVFLAFYVVNSYFVVYILKYFSLKTKSN